MLHAGYDKAIMAMITQLIVRSASMLTHCCKFDHSLHRFI
jgi:hypothetical protein